MWNKLQSRQCSILPNILVDLIMRASCALKSMVFTFTILKLWWICATKRQEIVNHEHNSSWAQTRPPEGSHGSRSPTKAMDWGTVLRFASWVYRLRNIGINFNLTMLSHLELRILRSRDGIAYSMNMWDPGKISVGLILSLTGFASSELTREIIAWALIKNYIEFDVALHLGTNCGLFDFGKLDEKSMSKPKKLTSLTILTTEAHLDSAPVITLNILTF